jgi:hypothetical protein
MNRVLFLRTLPWLFGTAFTLLTAAVAAGPRPFAHPDRIRYDSQCLTIDGKDVMIYSGAFHYFRCPKELWRDRFQKIKDAGFNCVETYAAWNWHEPDMPSGLGDFSKVTRLQDLDDWLTMAEQFGLYVIVRPGPYICAEWDQGGFPQWLMLKKPQAPLRGNVWLRTDDPVFLAWSKHWYDAVCPVIAKHQITRRAPGQPGVILFQVENEYNFWNLADDAKRNQLIALVNDAHADGIDVPLITCETSSVHGAPSGPLRSVFDCTNFYPRWNVVKELVGQIPGLRAAQPDAPLATTELQGGWFSNVGGQLSDQQDGLTAAQIQNLTLYAWQMGDTITNYYMLFGGTNFDDWGARDITTTYDYNAPIRENGGVGDRYQRVWALGHMLAEHGAKLVRAQAVDVTSTTTDKDVEIAERRAPDGSRYVFVRTENHDSPRAGHAQVKETDGAAPELDFDYKLEPFGSLVLYLPPDEYDATKGDWLPKPAPAIERPTNLPAPIAIKEMRRSEDEMPVEWATLAPGQPIESDGVLDSHFVYYRIAAQPGATVTVELNHGDGLVVKANGHLLPVSAGKDDHHVTFTLPSDAKDVVALYENRGHPNIGPALGMLNGIRSVEGASGPILFSPHDGFRDWIRDGRQNAPGLGLSDPKLFVDPWRWQPAVIGPDDGTPSTSLTTVYRAMFEMPLPKAGIWVPWHLHLEAKGNGFIYLNDHGLGRYWQVGPQHDFYVPECWLNSGPGNSNIVAIDLRPVDAGPSIQAISMAPDTAFAEKR